MLNIVDRLRAGCGEQRFVQALLLQLEAEFSRRDGRSYRNWCALELVNVPVQAATNDSICSTVGIEIPVSILGGTCGWMIRPILYDPINS